MNNLETPLGSYTSRTLLTLGVPWPPPRGWKTALLGRQIDKAIYDAAKQYSVKDKSPAVARIKKYRNGKVRCDRCGKARLPTAFVNGDPVCIHCHHRHGGYIAKGSVTNR